MRTQIVALILKLVCSYLDRKKKQAQQKVSPTNIKTGDIIINFVLGKD